MHGVFAEAEGGALRLAADWDALYRAEADPWGQSGADERLGPYYRESRARLARAVYRNFGNRTFRGIEIGAGLGHVVNQLATSFPWGAWAGLEISAVAVDRARRTYPRQSFHVADIADEGQSLGRLPLFVGRYDLVVFGQVWWYVLEHIDVAIGNALDLLDEGGVLIVSQAFLTGEQRYGADIARGFVGALQLLTGRFAGRMHLLEAEYEASGRYAHNDGLIVFLKSSVRPC